MRQAPESGVDKLSGSTDPITESIAALSLFFVGDGKLGDTLTRVSELTRDAFHADMAGITMLIEGKPRTGVFTDPAAPEIDAEQYNSGRGPCLDAFRHGQIFRITDTETEERWPEFARSLVSHGLRSTLSLPLIRTGEPIGALNIYAKAVGNFEDQDMVRAQMLAAQAAIVLSNAQAYHDARELSENLHQALESRATIDYAIGILMSAGGRSPDDAFKMLVRASQRENRKLRDIAAEIVERAQSTRRSAAQSKD